MKKFAYLLITSLAILSGCTTISDLNETKGQGKKETIMRSYDSVWNAAAWSVGSLGMRTVSGDKDLGEIFASKPISNFSAGENIAIFITPINQSSTTVEVVSKKVMSTNIFATDWTDPVFIRIKMKLGEDHPKADNLLPEVYVVQSAFDKLSIKDKEQIEQNYNLTYYNNNDIGFITERQVENVSTAGSTAGSDAGSALASVVYIDNALNTASYNVWTDLSVGILGAVAGSGANKAPVKQYIIKYSIRDLNNQIKSATVTQSSPIGLSVGLCFSLSKRKEIDSDFCTMTADDIRKKYLTKAK
jgi:hypothetical protein